MIFLKGISTLFSTLIIVSILISLSVPLLIYFQTLQDYQRSSINSSINQQEEFLISKITVIKLYNSSKWIFIYNYGNINIKISKLIIDNNKYNVNYTLLPNQIVRLSDLIGKDVNINGSIIILANDLYFTF